MKLDVRKNAKRNLVWGVLLKAYQVVVPLVIRQVFIFALGIEYAGLGGLFTSVLSVLNLAEMGVASAVIYFTYKPIAEDDEDSVRRLLGLFRRWYRRIGAFVVVVGVAVAPFVGFLIDGQPPSGIDIHVIFLLTLASSVISYFPFAYKAILLTSHQRDDVTSRIRLVATTVKYIAQLVVLICLRDYYAYLAIEIGAKLLERIITVVVVDRRYPRLSKPLEPTPEMSAELLKKTRALIMHQVGGVIVNSADAIVISAFLGLAVLGKYQNYTVVMGAVVGFVVLVNRATQAGIGNRLASADVPERRRLFGNYSFLVFAMSTVCCCCLLNMYQPFIELWLGADMLLDFPLVVAIVTYFFVLLLMVPGNHFESASGLWEFDRARPLTEGLSNLAMNLVLVQVLGLYGVLLSTIASMAFLSIPWLYYNVSKNLLGGGFRSVMARIAAYSAFCLATCALSWGICWIVPDGIPLMLKLVANAAISLVVPLAALFAVFRRTEQWRWMIDAAKSIVSKDV